MSGSLYGDCFWCGEPEFHHECVVDFMVDEDPYGRQQCVAMAYEHTIGFVPAAFLAAQQRHAAILSKWERHSRGLDV